jgi:hypothetical protein
MMIELGETALTFSVEPTSVKNVASLAGPNARAAPWPCASHHAVATTLPQSNDCEMHSPIP